MEFLKSNSPHNPHMTSFESCDLPFASRLIAARRPTGQQGEKR